MSSATASARRIACEHGDFTALVSSLPYAQFLGLQLSLQDDRPLARLPFRPSLIGNPRVRALHGGVTAAFMENTAMLHLLYQLDIARIPKSIDFSIDYLLPGRPQDLWADCEAGRIGSRVAQTTVRCWQATPEQPVAIARLHFLLAASD